MRGADLSRQSHHYGRPEGGGPARQVAPTHPTLVRRRVFTLTLCALCVMSSVGCSTLPKAEMPFHALHLVDVAQTINAGRDECFVEINPVTRRIIGEQPSAGQVLLWGAAVSLAQYGVSRALEPHPKAYRAFQVVTTYTQVQTIYKNHRVGVRPYGSNRRPSGC